MQFPSWLGVPDIKDLSTRFYNENVLAIRNWWNDHDSGARAWSKIRTGGIIGTTTNSVAASGDVGEYVSAFQSPTTVAGSTDFSDLTTISLTAGDWDVTCVAFFGQSGSTWSGISAGISVTSGNNSTGLVFGNNAMEGDWANSGTTPTGFPIVVPNVRFSLNTTTSLYLKVSAIFSAGTPTVRGRLSARRVR